MKSLTNQKIAQWVMPLLGAWIGIALLACGGGNSEGSSAPAWRGSKVLETNLLFDSTLPSVAVDAGGNALVAWQRDAGGPKDIWVKRLRAASGWDVEGTFENSDGNAQAPRVAVSKAGSYMVAWHQWTYSDTAVQVRRWTFGSNPEDIQRLNDDLTTGYWPSIAMDDSGNACVAWMQDRTDGSGLSDVVASTYRVELDLWSAPQTLSVSTTDSSLWPMVAMDASGDAVVVWAQSPGTDGETYTLHGARQKFGKTWSTPMTIGLGQFSVDTYYSVAYRAGKAMFAWSESSDLGNTFQVYCRSLETSSDALSKPQMVSSPSANAFSPLIGIDAQGQALMVWSQVNDANTLDLYSSNYSTQAGWSANLQAIAKNAETGYTNLSMNAQGQAALVWQQMGSTSWGINGALYSTHSGWGGVSPLSDDAAGVSPLSDDAAGVAYAPEIHVGASGRAVATWYQKDNDDIRHIYANYSW